VAKKNDRKGFVEDLASRLRGVLDELDRLINPPQQKPVRVPVPVPVRPERRPRYNDPYRSY
jgi:hypothetical protein